MDLTERREGASRHPWEVQRFRAYRQVLADHGALGARRVLDVGAGDGWFTDQLVADLPSGAETVCWDVNYDEHDLEPCRPGVLRTRERPEPGYDLVLLLDVIEHVDDPIDFIEQLRPLARPGTPVLVSVPAYQRLFGEHDRALGHRCRYGRRQFLDQLAPWIEIEEHASLFTSLLVPRALQVAVERRRPGAAADHGVGGWSGGSFVTTSVGWILALDACLGRALAAIGIRLPGLSHWAFGRVK